jgi:hypothetical protein
MNRPKRAQNAQKWQNEPYQNELIARSALYAGIEHNSDAGLTPG